jgi:hypothetical protein
MNSKFHPLVAFDTVVSIMEDVTDALDSAFHKLSTC